MSGEPTICPGCGGFRRDYHSPGSMCTITVCEPCHQRWIADMRERRDDYEITVRRKLFDLCGVPLEVPANL